MSSNDRDPIRAPRKDPWRTAPVIVAQIPDAGLHREIEADRATREALAATGDVPEVMSAQATFDLSAKRNGTVHVVGRVRARVGQTCVVTLEPMETDIDEPIDLMFAPPDQIPDMADLVEDTADLAEIPDPPEPIEGGQIDLGRLATDVLFLAIDPYPRKPGAMFEPETIADAPEDHPFAALRVLKSASGQTGAEPDGKSAAGETEASAQPKTKGK